jgi:hypothetical protein
MEINTASDRDLWWYVIIHLVFVGSSVLLALSEHIRRRFGGRAGEVRIAAARMGAGDKHHAPPQAAAGTKPKADVTSKALSRGRLCRHREGCPLNVARKAARARCTGVLKIARLLGLGTGTTPSGPRGS